MGFLKYNKLVAVFFLMLTVLFGYFLKDITIYHDIDKFVPENRDDLSFLNKFNASLESDDNYYLVAIENDGNSILEYSFLERIDAFSKGLAQLDNVNKVMSLTNVKVPIKTPFAFAPVSLLDWKNAKGYAKDSVLISKDERFYKRLVADDFKSTLLYVKTLEDLDKDACKSLDASIKALIATSGFANYHLGGRANIESEFVKLINKEIMLFLGACLIFLLVTLSLTFRKLWTILLALVSVVMGVVIFMGILGLIGRPLDMMAMLFPVLMLIIGMSDVIHFITNYSANIFSGVSKEEAVAATVKEIGWATFLTSLTTAIGFASLMLSQMEPIRVFGLYACIGVFVAYFVALFFTTSCLMMIPTKWIVLRAGRASRWDGYMLRVFEYVSKRGKKIGVITLVVFVLSIVGASQMSTNAFLLSDIPEKAKLRQDVSYFEEHYTGIRAFEMAVMPVGSNKITDLKVLQEIGKLEAFLIDNHVGSISSPTSLYKTLNRAYKGNRAEAYAVPKTKRDYKRIKGQVKRFEKTSLNKVVNKEENIGRITGMMKDLGSDKMRALNKEIALWVKTNTDPNVIEFRPTGSALLIDRNNEYLRQSIMESLGLAILAVSILMGIVYKDIRIVFISLIPNLIPLLFAAALIGIVGIELKAATSIVFAIAFGISVDDTIHFLTKYRIERKKGHSVYDSVRDTYLETGKAITMTTIILFFGFFILVFSSFKGIHYIGFLLSVTLFSALLSCLFVMPLFILKVLGKTKNG